VNSSRTDRFISCLRRHAPLLVILLLYFLVTGIYSIANPLGNSADEPAHVELIQFIAQHGYPPRNHDERLQAGYKSDYPMLYHTIIGLSMRGLDLSPLPRLKSSSASTYRLLIEDGLPGSPIIHTEDEAFPYRGIVLLYHLARLVSILLSAGTVIAVYILARRLFPDSRWLAVSAAALLAALPQFQFIASAVNDDNLLGLLTALFTLWLLMAWQKPESRILYLGMGLSLGFALSTKYSIALLPALVLVVLANGLRRRELTIKQAFVRLLIFAFSLALAASWYFIYVEYYSNKINELGLIPGLLEPLFADSPDSGPTAIVVSYLTKGAIAAPRNFGPSGNDSLTVWAGSLFQSFWFSAGNATLNTQILLSLPCLAVCALAAAGLIKAWRQRSFESRGILGLLVLQVSLLIPFPFVRYLIIRSAAETGQGRHILFPGAAAVALLLVIGLAAWFKEQKRAYRLLAIPTVLLLVSIYCFSRLVVPAVSAPLPVRTMEDADAGLPNPIDLAFSPAIQLAGYDVGAARAEGVLPVDLYWKSMGQAEKDYQVEMKLLDASGQAQSIWLSQPVSGRYPTRAWDKGDVVRDTAWLPLPASSGEYSLVLRMIAHGSESLPESQKDGLLLTKLSLSPPSRITGHVLSPQLLPVAGFDLWQDGRSMSGLPEDNIRAPLIITLQSAENGAGQKLPGLSLVGEDNQEHSPAAQTGETSIFIPDGHWSSGSYHLRLKQGETTFDTPPIARIFVRLRDFAAPVIRTPVQANFGNEIMLLGYDFPQRRVAPGGSLPITVYWQALRPIDAPYKFFNHLLNTRDLRQYGGRDRTPQDYYSPILWTPGEVVKDTYTVSVEQNAPPGVYRLDLGLYTLAAGLSKPLSLFEQDRPIDVNAVTISPIKVGGASAGVLAPAAAPQHKVDKKLGDAVTLLGYDLAQTNDAWELTLYWRCEAVLPADYTTFAHVLDSRGALASQADQPPAGGAYPSSLWDPGEIIMDKLRLPRPAQASGAPFDLLVGLYNLPTGERLAVPGSADNSLSLGTITP
jgi:4-amino-4-deoxy-L-arabinose transferase-like glycosyltransferase